MIEGLGAEVIGGLGTVINKIATGLTIQTAIGSDWQVLSDIKEQKNFDRLSDMIDYDEVRKDLEPYIETVDGYIAKHHQNLNESLLSAGYREQFVETFYKTHPQCLGMIADCDVYLEKYLDKLEHVLGSRMSEGEKIIWETVQKTDSTAADTNNTVNGIQETVNETKEIVSETKKMVSETKAMVSKTFAGNAGSIGSEKESSPSEVNDSIASLSFYKVRQLADNLWVNWETGVLAADRCTAMGSGIDVSGEVRQSKDCRVATDREAASAGERVSSGDAASEGETASSGDAASAGETASSGDAASSRREGRESACGEIFARLTARQLRLLSILVQGEGASVSWKELFWRGELLEEWREKYVKIPSFYADTKGIVEKQREPEPSEEEVIDIADTAVKALLYTEKRLASIICPSIGENGLKGYFIRLLPERSDLERRDLFADYVGCTETDDFKALKGKQESNTKVSRGETVHKPGKYVPAWLRRYYDQNCSFFEGKISNSRRAGINEDKVFGNYKMSQIYMNSYADAVRAEGQQKAMLDYVEDWYLNKDGSGSASFGRVLVLHGQPGDGKTTFCKKAVYAHCREGWLTAAPHVFQFSLNPGDSSIITGQVVDFTKAFCIKKKFNNQFYMDMEAFDCISSGEKTAPGLHGSLIILDGYDEFVNGDSNNAWLGDFSGFYEEVLRCAREWECNFIITSRTMCIETELARFSGNTSTPVAAFAPMQRAQQEAMLDRMIELDADPKPLKDYRGVLHKLWENSDPKLDDFKKLLGIPILFRMIVRQRFDRFEGINTVGELYGHLFFSLLDYKDYEHSEKRKQDGRDARGRNKEGKTEKSFNEELVSRYEDVAIGVFNYGNGICPFKEDDEIDKKLVYYFYTTRDGRGTQYLGFLHMSFYQYFLARYIVSSIRKIGEKAGTIQARYSDEKEKTEQEKEKLALFVRFFASLRAKKLSEPNLWKLVSELAGLEQEKNNHAPQSYECLLFHDFAYRVGKRHVREVLRCLNEDSLTEEVMLAKDPMERGSECDGDGNKRTRYQDMENAVYNLVCACAAVEKGCRQSSVKREPGKQGDDWIAYADYPNLCEMLRRGDYSGISFEEVNLDSCHLKGSQFQNAHMARATFANATLDGADLAGADLRGAVLSDASLKKVNLTNAILEGAHLEGAHFHGMSSEDACKSICADGLVPDASVVRVDGARLRGAKMSNARLEGANLIGADLDRADLRDAHLDHAKLVGASLVLADMKRAWLTGGKLSWADLKDTCLEGVRLEGAELDYANLEDAYLKKAVFDSGTTEHMKTVSLRGAVCDEVLLGLMRSGRAVEHDTVRLAQEAILRGETRKIAFGRYPQDEKLASGQWEKTPLLWRVLKVDKENHRALLITEKLIDCTEYNKADKEDITWEDCTLRQWLNGEFVRMAFTVEEASRIVPVWNENEDNVFEEGNRYGVTPRYIKGGDATRDRVFAMSIAEAHRYFKNDMDRRAAPTTYAVNKGSYVYGGYKTTEGEETGWWRLRSPCHLSDSTAYVHFDGDVFGGGNFVDYSSVSVRPALWLHL